MRVFCRAFENNSIVFASLEKNLCEPVIVVFVGWYAIDSHRLSAVPKTRLGEQSTDSLVLWVPAPHEKFLAALLRRKLDLDLTAMEVQVLYRAIDWDHAGAVSFVKFVESQVLRAKLLFQRFDVGKQHALTFIKFRDLLHSLDAGFPDDEVDAIYRLVREPSDWKLLVPEVHLTGFMSPNIVKLKLIFDKNDKQRRRILTSQEFSALLQEPCNTSRPERQEDRNELDALEQQENP
eukprot:2174159-Amphidinium_carterae.1